MSSKKMYAPSTKKPTAKRSTNTALHGQETQSAPTIADERIRASFQSPYVPDEEDGSLFRRLPRVRELGYALRHRWLRLVYF
jgi:hypothetical protein